MSQCFCQGRKVVEKELEKKLLFKNQTRKLQRTNEQLLKDLARYT